MFSLYLYIVDFWSQQPKVPFLLFSLSIKMSKLIIVPQPNPTYLVITQYLRWAPNPCGGGAVRRGSKKSTLSFFSRFWKSTLQPSGHSAELERSGIFCCHLPMPILCYKRWHEAAICGLLIYVGSYTQVCIDLSVLHRHPNFVLRRFLIQINDLRNG
jgi:hypothetical protein